MLSIIIVAWLLSAPGAQGMYLNLHVAGHAAARMGLNPHSVINNKIYLIASGSSNAIYLSIVE